MERKVQQTITILQEWDERTNSYQTVAAFPTLYEVWQYGFSENGLSRVLIAPYFDNLQDWLAFMNQCQVSESPEKHVESEGERP